MTSTMTDPFLLTAPRSREQPTVYHDSRPRGYSTSHTPTSRPAMSFGSAPAGPPESSRAAARRRAPGLSNHIGQVGSVLISIDYGATSAPANALDPIPMFGQEGRPSDVFVSRGPTVSRHGSSLDAQTSTGSYLNYDTTAAPTTASGHKTSRFSVEGSKSRLDPSEDTSPCSVGKSLTICRGVLCQASTA